MKLFLLMLLPSLAFGQVMFNGYVPQVETPVALAVDDTSVISRTQVSTGAVNMTFASTNQRLALVTINGKDFSFWKVDSVKLKNAGTSFTRIDSVNRFDLRTEVWKLLAPPTGTDSVKVWISASTVDWVLGCVSFVGVNQTTPYGTPASGGFGVSPLTETISSTSGNIMFATGAVASGTSATEGSGVTSWFNLKIGNVVGVTGQKAAGGSVTVQYTYAPSGNNGTYWVVEIND